MKNTSFKITALILMYAVAFSAASCGQNKFSSLKGTWAVDHELTMENMKKNPKFEPETVDKFSAIIKQLIEYLKVEVTDSTIIYHTGPKKQELGFTVESSPSDKVVLRVRQLDQFFTLTFMFLKDGAMTFTSTGSDDMNFYIWRKVEGN